MSYSARKRQNMNRDTMGSGQGLLDFLKRKKQYNLESTLNKTFFSNSHTKRKPDADGSFAGFQQTKTNNEAQYLSVRQAKRPIKQMITPKKIDFLEEKYQHKSNNRLAEEKIELKQPRHDKSNFFLSMISPYKSRPMSALANRESIKENLPKSSKKQTQVFAKKNVTRSINDIKHTLVRFNEQVLKAKQKAASLNLGLAPIFKYLGQGKHPVSSHVGDLRNNLRSFQSAIQSVSTHEIDTLAQNFHRTLEAHMQVQQGGLRLGVQKFKQQQWSNLKQNKQRVIQQLQAQNKRLLKDNSNMQKKLQKLENSKEGIKQALSDRELNHVQQLDRMKNDYQSQILNLTKTKEQLQRKCQSLQDQNRCYQKQLKNERMFKEEIQEKSRNQIQSVIQSKDAYLLNEIMVLKAEFSADISRLNQMHRIKEEQFLTRIERNEKEVVTRLQEQARQSDKRIEQRILQESRLVKEQNLKLKAKNDCIVTDMFRMNEELYQHWGALKDIKILQSRLGTYAHIKKIYEDIRFNERLFS